MYIPTDDSLIYAASTPVGSTSDLGGNASMARLLREYLEAIHVSVDLADQQGWRVYLPLFAPSDTVREPLLLIPAHGRDGLLAVRSVSLIYLNDYIDDEYRQKGVPMDTTRDLLIPTHMLGHVNDVPTPNWAGILDGNVVGVSRDPFHALRLQGLDMTASALAHPAWTLGSPMGQDYLERTGSLSARNGPWGILVLLDEGEDLSPEGYATLRQVYDEVWEAPEVYRAFYRTLDSAANTARAHGTSVEHELLQHVRALGRSAPQEPEPLDYGSDDRVAAFDDDFGAAPADWGGRGGHGTREPLELVRMSELPTMASTVEWLVEDFVAYNTITELQGVPKEGKTTLE